MDTFFFVALGTLLTIVNPVGAVPAFLSMTLDNTRSERNSLAKKATFIAGGTLLGCAALGSVVFSFYGITLPAVKIAGGILVLLIAIDMLHAKKSRTRLTDEEKDEAQSKDEVGVFPLAIPLLTGPGSILSTFMLMDQAQSFWRQASVFVSVIVVMLVAFVVFTQAHHITRIMGKTGINVMSRLMGIVLASIAIQFIIDGLKESLPGLAG